MKRDADLIRDILLSVEADHIDIKSKITNEKIVNHHLHLMIDGGLLDGKEINEGQWRVYGLTWEGYELLELIRDVTRWQEIERITGDINCYSFGIIQKLAKKLME
jgi:DNA-binding HxlR family transcriptional regulator